MDGLIKQINTFIDVHINSGGYVKVMEGMRNTVINAVQGLTLGSNVGTMTVRVRFFR